MIFSPPCFIWNISSRLYETVFMLQYFGRKRKGFDPNVYMRLRHWSSSRFRSRSAFLLVSATDDQLKNVTEDHNVRACEIRAIAHAQKHSTICWSKIYFLSTIASLSGLMNLNIAKLSVLIMLGQNTVADGYLFKYK